MDRLPTLFVSHGSPTFALEPGVVGPRLAALGDALPRPEAVLVVSPHWMTPAPRVGTAAQPRTIHDFGGFAPELYEIVYPASGHPRLAQRTLDALRDADWPAEPDEARGLDHGAWVPLLHLYPRADVPVFQVSLPARLDADAAWDLGAALAPLSGEGVLIVGSGSVTHNLQDVFGDDAQGAREAAAFAAWVRDAVAAGDEARLRRALAIGPHATRVHPTPEHFRPLLVAAGAAGVPMPATVIEGGIVQGALAMDAFVFGPVGV